MRETDLLAFEIGIQESGVGAVMCSYNMVNGDYACENDYLLNDVLKKDFGFQGFVVSDWGGTHSTVKAALAGLDMEMPGNDYFGDALKKAVERRRGSARALDDMVHRILRTEFAVGLFDNPPAAASRRCVPRPRGGPARRRAGHGAAEEREPPAAADAAQIQSIAVIGSHADVGVLSGGGSAQVDPPGGNAVPPPPAARPVSRRCGASRCVTARRR